MLIRRHIHFGRTFLQGLLILLLSLGACQRPYSPASYRAQSESQQFAIICHGDKRTLRVPAEEWPIHREHGDYRGPCRPRGPVGKLKKDKTKHTAVSYDDAKPRAKESYAEWAEKKAIKDAYIDSLKTAHQHSQEEKE